MDVEPFQQLQQAAAAADGVQSRRPPSLGSFRSATPATVAASQTSSSPLPSVDGGTPTPAAEHGKVGSKDVVAEDKHKSDEAQPALGVEFEVDLDCLHVLPVNSRFDYSEQEVDDMLAAFLREGKQLKAIEITPHESIPGHYYVLDGETRKRGLRKWGKSKGRAVIVDVQGPWEQYKASWYSNNGSRHTTDYDNGMRWRQMINDGHVTQPQISVTLGEKFSQTTVSRIMSINRFPEVCRDYIRDHKNKLSSGFYYIAHGLMKELEKEERMAEQVLDVLKMAVEEDLSARVFEERVAKIISGRETTGQAGTPAAPKVVAPILFGGREVGSMREWVTQDRLDISMKKVPVDVRDKIKDAVRKIFAEAGLPPEGAP